MNKQAKIKLGVITLFVLVGLFSLYFVLAGNVDEKDVDEKVKDRDYIDDLRNKDITQLSNDKIGKKLKYKSYDSSEKKLLIEDKDYKPIIKMRLTSPYIVSGLIASNDTKVADFYLEDWKDGKTNLIDSMNFYDVKNNYKPTNKNFRLKYGIDYEECHGEGQQQQCYPYTLWTEFEILDELPHKNIAISLWANTEVLEKIEWVPTIEGFEILQWGEWDVSSAVYILRFDITTEETVPLGLFFKPDGTRMYIIGGEVNEYNLTTPWNVASADWLRLFSAGGQDVFFKPDGTKMYIIGGPVNEYDLSDSWNISSAVWLQSFSVATEEGFPKGFFFKPDGTKMYIIGTQTGGIDGADEVNEYDLSDSWNISSAVWLQLFSVSGRERYPQDVFFKPDGSKMYIVGTDGDSVDEYDLSDAWNITSAVWLQLKYLGEQNPIPTGLFFNSDGSKMYMLGDISDEINEYDLPDILPPNVTVNTPLNQTYTTNTIVFNITAIDEKAMDSCWYSLDSGTTNYTMTNISSEYTDTNSSMAQGSHTVNFYCNDTTNNINDTEDVSFFIDSINPVVTSLTESPSDPATYSSGATYEFNATITDTNLQTVLIEFDGVNYTPSNLGDVYSFSISDLSVGVYNYRWYANDTLGNINNTETGDYTINKADPSTNMVITGTTPIIYPATSDFSESETNTGDGGCSYSMDRSNGVYGVNTWTFNYSTTGCANYSAGYVTKDLVVNQNSIYVLSITGTTPIVYGTITDVAGGDCPAELSCSLDKANAIYSAGIETFNYSTPGNTNYSANYITKGITINKATPTGTLNSNLGWTINETQEVVISLSESNTGDGGVTYIIYRDGVSKGTGETWTPTYGNHNYVLNTTGGTNYSAVASLDSETLAVNDIINPLIDFEAQTPVDNFNQSSTSLYVNVTFTETNFKNITFNLYSSFPILENSTTFTTPTYEINWTGLSDDTYTYYVNITDQAGNKNSTEIRTITIDATPPTITIDEPQAINYANNDTIELNYSVSDLSIGVSTCWYKVVNSTNDLIIDNTTITDCLNTTFSLPGGDIDYTLTLYANDSLNNINSENVTFGIRTNSPSIVLDSPSDNGWVTEEIVYFNFTATDSDGLDTCQLWGNWSGGWHNNYTWISPSSGVMNYTTVNLSDDSYIWNIWCNDTLNNNDWALDNFTVSVDTINPDVEITTTNQTTFSSLSFTIEYNITDTNLDICYFTLRDSDGNVHNYLENTTLNCSLNSRSLSTLVYGIYNIQMWGEDLADNFNSSIITLTTQAPPVTPPAGGGSTPVEETRDIVAFNHSNVLTGEYSDLDRAKFFAEYFKICTSRYPNQKCQITRPQLDEVCIKTFDGVAIDSLDCLPFYKMYLADETIIIDVSKSLADEFGLIRDFEGIRFLLEIDPLILDIYWLKKTSDNVKYSIKANKPLTSCRIVEPENNGEKSYRFDCQIIGNTTGKIILTETDPDVFAFTYEALIEWRAVEQDQVYFQRINIRMINIDFKGWWTFGLPLRQAIFIHITLIILLIYLFRTLLKQTK